MLVACKTISIIACCHFLEAWHEQLLCKNPARGCCPLRNFNIEGYCVVALELIPLTDGEEREILTRSSRDQLLINTDSYAKFVSMLFTLVVSQNVKLRLGTEVGMASNSTWSTR